MWLEVVAIPAKMSLSIVIHHLTLTAPGKVSTRYVRKGRVISG